MKRQKRLTKAQRQERGLPNVLDPQVLAEAVNPGGVFGDVDELALAKKLSPEELYCRVFRIARGRGSDRMLAALVAHTALCHVANGGCVHTDEELAVLLPMMPAACLPDGGQEA